MRSAGASVVFEAFAEFVVGATETALASTRSDAPVMRKTPPTATDADSSITATATEMSPAGVRCQISAQTVRTGAAGVATASDAKRPASVEAVWAMNAAGFPAEGDAGVCGDVPSEFRERRIGRLARNCDAEVARTARKDKRPGVDRRVHSDNVKDTVPVKGGASIERRRGDVAGVVVLSVNAQACE